MVGGIFLTSAPLQAIEQNPASSEDQVEPYYEGFRLEEPSDEFLRLFVEFFWELRLSDCFVHVSEKRRDSQMAWREFTNLEGVVFENDREIA